LFCNKDVVAPSQYTFVVVKLCTKTFSPGEKMGKIVPWKLRQQWALSCCLKRRSRNNIINNNNNNNINNSIENRGKDFIM
jgi:hypothetical protein